MHEVIFIRSGRCGNPLAETLEGEFFLCSKLCGKNAGSWLIKVLFIIIVVVFIFWGVGTQQDNKGDRVAVVNGEAISVESFQSMYDNAVENLKRLVR